MAHFGGLQAYHGLSHCCGVPQLAKKLNQVSGSNDNFASIQLKCVFLFGLEIFEQH